ncbi:MAG: hypothetical protein K2M93_09485 [Muribaculaceae bacterium]|nr:hypothetical protein [Muribaculaceae bacterium]
MNKKVIYGVLTVALIVSFSLMARNNTSSINVDEYCESAVFNQTLRENDIPEDARPIKVYLIVGANGAGVPKDAKYSSTTNRIYIQEGKRIMNYNVCENRHYGQERDPKGAYKYTAGNYYFDL